jgi:hypothetical protein
MIKRNLRKTGIVNKKVESDQNILKKKHGIYETSNFNTELPQIIVFCLF